MRTLRRPTEAVRTSHVAVFFSFPPTVPLLLVAGDARVGADRACMALCILRELCAGCLPAVVLLLGGDMQRSQPPYRRTGMLQCVSAEVRQRANLRGCAR